MVLSSWQSHCESSLRHCDDDDDDDDDDDHFPIFNDVSRKKIAVLPGRPFVPFVAFCPRFVQICPSLKPCACTSAAIYMYIRKKSLSMGAPPDPAGGAHDAPPYPQVGPQRLAPVALAPYDWRSSRIAVPKLWSPNPHSPIRAKDGMKGELMVCYIMLNFNVIFKHFGPQFTGPKTTNSITFEDRA